MEKTYVTIYMNNSETNTWASIKSNGFSAYGLGVQNFGNVGIFR